jgi:hypothetical protein
MFVYLRDRIVYVLAEGIGREMPFIIRMEPITIVHIEEEQRLAEVLKDYVDRPMPIVPLSEGKDKNLMAKYTKYKTGAAFEKRAWSWGVTRNNHYTFTEGGPYPKGRVPSLKQRTTHLPLGTSLDEVARYLVDLIKARAD